MPPRLSFLRVFTVFLTVAVAAVFLPACGKKANPVVPTAIFPKSIDDLAYRIQGSSLVLTWTPPKFNTDGSPLADLKGYQLNRGDFPVKDYCATCPDQFKDKLWIDPKGPELPGIRVEDDLVAITYDQLKPGTTYLFQAVTQNKNGVFSEPSKTLKVTWEIPLSPPVLMELKLKSDGVEVAWEPPQTLVDGAPAAGLAGYLVFRKPEKGGWEPVTPKPISDLSLSGQGRPGRGAVYLSGQVAAGSLREPAGKRRFRRKIPDLYPDHPAPCRSGSAGGNDPQAIQLRWQELDQPVQGYHLYRRTAQEKTAKRLTREPVSATLYEDRQVQPGQVYYYSISAIGPAPHRTEGPRSRETAITYNP